jgi:hypothetical protein
VGFWHRHTLAVIVLSLLAAQPALNVLCLAACEPGSARPDVASHHVMTGACHDGSGSGMQVNAASTSACGDHDRTMIDPAATVTASRDDLSPFLTAASTAFSLLLEIPDVTRVRATDHALAPPSTRSTILVVLRI